LSTPVESWSPNDQRRYGNPEEVRNEKKDLREKEKQLLKIQEGLHEEKKILQEKEKQLRKEKEVINKRYVAEKEVEAKLLCSSQSTRTQPASFVPHPKRKQRWIELNKVLDQHAKKLKTTDSTAYSFVTWNQVNSIFNTTKYVQERKGVDDDHLNFLAKYLSFATKCFADIGYGNEAKRLHLIAPVLICVCILFDGDVEIVVEEDLVGNFVKAHGHFEFMLKRGKRAVCIVEAKKYDVEQGTAQDLVGCEVAAEVGELDIVYGIVTTYFQWNFFRSLNDKVEFEECSLSVTPEGPDRNTLKIIVEKIYAMLSND